MEKNMNKFFILTVSFIFLITLWTNSVPAQNEAYENKAAPANYDANLKAGSKAVAVLLGDLEEISIVSKSGGVYKTLLEDRDYDFRANSVYPYFDIQAFGEITNYGYGLLEAYLPCYAKKHNRELSNVTGDGFRPPYFSDLNDMKTTLQAGQTKLVEIETRLKSLSARPDTFLPFENNPAVWEDIAVNRANYLKCALGERQTEDIVDSPWLKAHRDGIKKVMGYVENWKAGSRDALGSESEYAFYAVSPKMRAAWLKEKNALAFEGEIEKLLKPLSDALAEKVPNYFPQPERFAFSNAGEEAMMKSVLTNLARYKVFKIGLMQSSWRTDPGVLGIPNARFKNGMIYRRDTQADHPYCYATYVNIVQDYGGGGTYAASRAVFVQDELVACPAGTK